MDRRGTVGEPVDVHKHRELQRIPVLGLIALIALAFGLGLYIYRLSKQEPKQLAYWLNKAATQDWTAEAAAGKAEAELCVGLSLIRTNLVVMIDRVPALASVPVLGKRFFEKTHYSLDGKLSPERQMLAYGYIKKARDQGFVPAVEAEALFAGRMPALRGNPVGDQQVALTNRSE